MAKKDTVVFTWGRFNPPTTGHEKLIEKVAAEASQRNADYKIFPTKSQDPKKNPLTFKTKVRFMKKLYPKHAKNISTVDSVKTVIKVAETLSSKGYDNLVLVVGSDRVKEFETLLNRYNGKEFTFDTISVISAGDRDPDAKDVSGMSASKMRAAAVAGNFKAFAKGVPLKPIAKNLYDEVRLGMKINERFEADGIFDYVEKLSLNEDFGKDPRFMRMLRFGLSTPGDIPITKRAFADMNKSGSSPALREKIFSAVNTVFEYLLEDDLLYNRFLLLLHRASIFDECADNMSLGDLRNILSEAPGTAALPVVDDAPGDKNYVARFGNADSARRFENDITRSGLGRITWKSDDGREVQLIVLNSTAGQESPGRTIGSADDHNRYDTPSTLEFGAEVRIVDLAMKHGGKLSRFDGDVREAAEDFDHTDDIKIAVESLEKKAEKSDIGFDIILEVYFRGIRSWSVDCVTRERTTPDQWAFARVNSFLAGGNSLDLDLDLHEEVQTRANAVKNIIDENFERNDELAARRPKRLNDLRSEELGALNEAFETIIIESINEDFTDAYDEFVAEDLAIKVQSERIK